MYIMVFSDAELKGLSSGMSLAPLPPLPGGGEPKWPKGLIFFCIEKKSPFFI